MTPDRVERSVFFVEYAPCDWCDHTKVNGGVELVIGFSEKIRPSIGLRRRYASPRGAWPLQATSWVNRWSAQLCRVYGTCFHIGHYFFCVMLGMIYV